MSKLTERNHTLCAARTAGLLVTLGFVAAIQIKPALAGETEHPWVAPEASSKVENPVKGSLEGLKSAAALYQQNCMICHGAKGDSNGPAAQSLPRHPANFTDAKMMQKATDGELFWKMSTGRAPMPSWQDRLSETQRWQLVNYLRKLTRERKYKYLGKTS